MTLTDTQKAKVAEWVQANKPLADIQRLIREEFSLSLTYMDLRFLIDDLEISFVEPEPEPEPEPQAGDAAAAAAAVEEPEIMDSGVSVDVDAIVRPGALVSGTVRFSDGQKLGWQLSASGQLGLIPGDDPEYRPAPEDVQEFQAQLETVLRQKGF